LNILKQVKAPLIPLDLSRIPNTSVRTKQLP